MCKPSNLSYARAMRTSKNRFTCNINPYRGTKISVVFKANLRSLASNFSRGVPPDLLQGFSSLLSSSGIPLAPSSKKLYLGPWSCLKWHRRKLWLWKCSNQNRSFMSCYFVKQTKKGKDMIMHQR